MPSRQGRGGLGTGVSRCLEGETWARGPVIGGRSCEGGYPRARWITSVGGQSHGGEGRHSAAVRWRPPEVRPPGSAVIDLCGPKLQVLSTAVDGHMSPTLRSLHRDTSARPRRIPRPGSAASAVDRDAGTPRRPPAESDRPSPDAEGSSLEASLQPQPSPSGRRPAVATSMPSARSSAPPCSTAAAVGVAHETLRRGPEFYLREHRLIFQRHARALRCQEQAIDPITVGDHLRKHRRAGPTPVGWTTSPSCRRWSPPPRNVSYHAGIVRETSLSCAS